MNEIWIAILLYTKTQTAQSLSEFPSEKVCWENYSGDQSFGTQLKDHQNKPITKDYHFKKQGAEYPIRLFIDSNTKKVFWLLCERKDQLTGTEIPKYPLTILLPTPT
jgi:hypothetical protein